MTLTIIIANECDAYQRLLSYFKLSCLEIEKQYHVSITQFNFFEISYVYELLTFLFTRISYILRVYGNHVKEEILRIL